MKKYFTISLLTFFYGTRLFAQLAENTPCTAICIDANKTLISGKGPNPDGISPNTYFPCNDNTSKEDNPLWFTFCPKTNNITFDFSIINCKGNGLQISMWKGNDCQSLTYVNCTIGSGASSISATVVPNDIYYLQLDGISEDQCNFIIKYDNKLLNNSSPQLPLKKEKACLNSTLKYSVTYPIPRPTGMEYFWSLSPSSLATLVPGTETQKTVSVKFGNQIGKVKLFSQLKYKDACLALGKIQEYEIEIVADTILSIAKCQLQICEKDQPFVLDIKKCFPDATNTDFATYVVHNILNGKDSVITKTTYYDTKTGCKSLNIIDINVKNNVKPIVVTLSPILLCQGDSIKIKERVFSCKDASIQPIRFSKKGIFECDTTYEVIVQCIEVSAICRPYYTVFDCMKKSNQLDLSYSTLFPPNLSTSEFTGIGNAEYIFTLAQKDTLTSKLNLINAVTVPAKVKYNYFINHKNQISKKTCESKISIPTFTKSGLFGAEDFIIEPKNPCIQDIFETKILLPNIGATYTWEGDTNTIPLSPTVGLSFSFKRKNPSLKTDIKLLKTGCNLTDAGIIELQTLNPITPVIDFTISGKSNICQNEISAYLIDKLPRGIKYKWGVTNGKLLSAADSNWVLVSWDNAKNNGQVSLEASDNCGLIVKKTYNVTLLQTCRKCITNAGELQLKFIITANKISKSIAVRHLANSSNLGYDDTFAFLLHDGDAKTIGNILSSNKTGVFEFDSTKMKCNRVYYVTYTVGKNKNGLPDKNDKCYQVVPKGQPVSWLCKIKSPIAATRNKDMEEVALEESLDIQIFPNPTDENFFVVTPSQNKVTICLLDIHGRLVLNQDEIIRYDNTHFEVPVSNLDKGIYIFRVNINGKYENRKIIIQ